jgi:periplasmic divalent cation tolerance protein
MENSDQNAAATIPPVETGVDRKPAATAAAPGRVALIYTTFPSKSEAKKAGQALVESGMAACVNIFPKMVSFYMWEGKLEKSKEAAMLIKTAAFRREEVLAEVKRLHPYSLPARLVLALDGGGDDFLDWIQQQTGVTAAS